MDIRRIAVAVFLLGVTVVLILRAQVFGGAARTTPTLAADPRLSLYPRTVVQEVRTGGMDLTIEVHPTIPGANRFRLRVRQHGRPLEGAHVEFLVTMPEMRMRPAVVAARVEGHGYRGQGDLPMFGRWHLEARIADHGRLVTHVFTVSLRLPAALQGLLQSGLSDPRERYRR